MAIDLDKRALRRTVRAAIAQMSPEARRAGSAAVVQHLRGRLTGGAVLLYAALSDEIDVGGLFDGVDLVLPRVTADGLVLHRIGPGDEGWVLGPFGIREPRPDLPVVSPAEVAVAVVPGRAFDRRGARLGRGGAYYDRLLPGLAPGTPTLGVGFACQLVDVVPMADHDVPLSAVVTPEGILDVSRPDRAPHPR